MAKKSTGIEEEPRPRPRSPIIATTGRGPVRRQVRGTALARLLRTTDAKQIGLMYFVTSFSFFVIGGVIALLMRGELGRPGLQFLSPEQYNQLLTMHGTIMLLLFATPLLFAFANYIVPLQIGAPDVAFPRLNSLAYWLYLFGGLIVVGGFVTPGGAPDFGWTAYATLSEPEHTPGVGGDMWIVGLVLSGLGTIFGSVNMITTVLTLRAPGMTMRSCRSVLGRGGGRPVRGRARAALFFGPSGSSGLPARPRPRPLPGRPGDRGGLPRREPHGPLRPRPGRRGADDGAPA
jgi:cytochrome c oxidase subunit 1